MNGVARWKPLRWRCGELLGGRGWGQEVAGQERAHVVCARLGTRPGGFLANALIEQIQPLLWHLQREGPDFLIRKCTGSSRFTIHFRIS